MGIGKAKGKETSSSDMKIPPSTLSWSSCWKQFVPLLHGIDASLFIVKSLSTLHGNLYIYVEIGSILYIYM